MAAFQSQAQKHKPGLGQSQEEWTVREKLTLASSVQRSGDQNWVSVSRAIKPINDAGCLGRVRPPDFFSQKNCAILYSQMLEKVNTPKRKRTNETGTGETPGEQIIRKLTFERIEELKKSIKNDQLTYRKLKMRIEDIRSGKVDAQLPVLWEEIQARKRRMEELQQMQQSASLQSSGGDSAAISFPTPPGINFSPGGNNAPMAGLKQSPTQPMTPSPHKGKQLRIPKPTPRFQKYQQQLQQRHGQGGQHLTPSGSPVDINTSSDSPRSSFDGPRLSLDEPLKTEPMDIDPGAAVQTVSMEMPPVGTGQLVTPKVEPGVMTPSQGSMGRRLSSGNVTPQGESLKILLSQPAKEPANAVQPDEPKKGTETQQTQNSKPQQDSHTTLPAPGNQPPNKQLTSDGMPFLGNRSNPDANKLDSLRERMSTNADAPSVTAPTLSKLLSTSSSPNNNKTIVNSTSTNSFIEKSLGSKTIESGINNIRSSTGISGRGAITVGGKGDEGGCVAMTSISVNPKAALTAGTLPSPMSMTPPPSTPPAEKKEEIITESIVKTIEPVPSQSERKSIEQIQDTKDDGEVLSNTTEQSLPPEPKIEVVDTPTPSPRVTGRTRAPKPGRPGRPRGRRSQRRSKSVTSTDNETEVEEEKEEDNKSESMEVESEKASEKDEEEDDIESTVSEKKDSDDDEQESIDDGYSESGDRSKEESFVDRASTIGSESVPASPASQTSQGDMDSEAVQAQKTWRKSIMLVWRAAANHKYANVFLHAVTDDEAPGYHNIVFRPMDLTTIKKNIENGTIRSTSEFQRDMMLMFQNALMYNNSDHDVYRMAEEMRDDVMDQIQSYIATQLMVQSSDRDSTKMLRGHRSDVFHFFL